MDRFLDHALSLFGVQQTELNFARLELEHEGLANRSRLRSSSTSSISSASTYSSEGSQLRSCLKAKKSWAVFCPKSALKDNCSHVHFEPQRQENGGRMFAARPRRYSISRAKRN
eukprot:3228892-Rhodomonas_salina.2